MEARRERVLLIRGMGQPSIFSPNAFSREVGKMERPQSQVLGNASPSLLSHHSLLFQ